MADTHIDPVAASLVSALHAAKDLPAAPAELRKRKTPSKRRRDGYVDGMDGASTEDDEGAGEADYIRRIQELLQKTEALAAKLPKKMRIATVAFLPGGCKAVGTPLLANVIQESQELIENSMIRRGEDLANVAANIPYLPVEEVKRPLLEVWRPVNERFYGNMYPGQLFTQLTQKIRAFLKLGNGSTKPNYKQAEVMRTRLPFYPDDVPCVKPGKHQVSETVLLHVAIDNHYQMVKFVEDHNMQFVPPLHDFTRHAWKAALLLCEQNDLVRLQTEGFIQPKVAILEGALQVAKQSLDAMPATIPLPPPRRVFLKQPDYPAA
eukprot:TRINITY_DN1204_c0_g1_i1.p1 TRINITY_DN1204_c0_g1~~TRINITY_DN1204_c0_g1_i1.p1  ORF type:complete len:355 (+),score=67.18 TRINITY_DN1204_c0_g1_i1:105-1067(+)